MTVKSQICKLSKVQQEKMNCLSGEGPTLKRL